MITKSVDRQRGSVANGNSPFFSADYFCRSDERADDTYPKGASNADTLLELVVDANGDFANKWRIHIYDATASKWCKFAEWEV